jgi:hypothetical protein
MSVVRGQAVQVPSLELKVNGFRRSLLTAYGFRFDDLTNKLILELTYACLWLTKFEEKL